MSGEIIFVGVFVILALLSAVIVHILEIHTSVNLPVFHELVLHGIALGRIPQTRFFGPVLSRLPGKIFETFQISSLVGLVIEIFIDLDVVLAAVEAVANSIFLALAPNAIFRAGMVV